MTGLDSRPAASSGALAGTVAVILALGLGLAVGDPIPMLTGLVGGLCVAAGVWALRSDSHTRIAGGSVAVLVGATVFCSTALLVTDTWLLVPYLGFPLGATLVVIDASTGLVSRADETDELAKTLEQSFVVLVFGIAIAIVCAIAASVRLPWVLGRVIVGFSMHPLVGFVTLQILAVLFLVTLNAAIDVLESWIPAPMPSTTDRALDRLDMVGRSWWDFDPVVKAALGLQLLVAFAPPAQLLTDRFLASVPVLGPALWFALSGPLHIPLVVGLLVLATIPAAELLRQWLLQWLGSDPGRSLARQAGGITVPIVLLLGAFVLTAAGVTTRVAPTGGNTGHYGSAIVMLLGVFLSVVALRSVHALLTGVAQAELLSRRVTGLATGSALLFVTTLVSAELGLAPLLVLVGSAASLLVWDAGVHASSIGHQLGRDAETTDSEFVHVTGTAAALTGAILVVLAVRYLLIPSAIPAGPAELSVSAVLALGLVLLSIVAFVLALNAHDGEPRRNDQPASESD